MGKYSNLWDREKDGGNHEQRSFLRYAIVVTVLVVVFLFLKKDGIIRWAQAGFTIRGQQKEIERLQESNAELDRRIVVLETDRDSLETYARENFGFTAPGEDRYIVEK